MVIFAGNLPEEYNVAQLQLRFSEYGEVTYCRIIHDKDTETSHGFGFINMPNDEAATRAIQHLDKTQVEDNIMRVVEAHWSSIEE